MDQKNVHIKMEGALHSAIRIKALQAGETMQAYIVRILEREISDPREMPTSGFAITMMPKDEPIKAPFRTTAAYRAKSDA